MRRLLQRPHLALAIAAMLAAVPPGTASAETVSLGVTSAEVGYDSRTSEPIVTVRLTPATRQVFAEFTRKNVGRPVSLLVDGQVIHTTTIREPIEGGAGQLRGFSVDTAKELAARLSSGQSELEVRNAD